MNDTVQNQQSVQQPTQQPPKLVKLGQVFQGTQQPPLDDTAQVTSPPNLASTANPAHLANTAHPAQADDNTQKLDTFESVLDEIQSTVPHGIVQAVDQATDTLNPQQPAGGSKERIEPVISADTTSIDVGGGVQSVEQEKNPEIPVEVESFLQRVEDHHDTAPTEVVIADGTSEVPTNAYPSRPVIVLPITQKEEQEGAKKSPKFSFRWLVEFSHKIVKMFTGKVIYRQEES